MKPARTSGLGFHPPIVTLVIGLAMLTALVGPAIGQQADSSSTSAGRTILGGSSDFRWHVTLRRPTVSAEALSQARGQPTTQPAALPIKLAWNPIGDVENIQTAPPPGGWTAAGFDDGDWSVATVPFEPALSVGTLCLRGRFNVTDPAAVKSLALSMDLRGGAIIYLNGKEVARAYMPAGPASADAPAEPYPDEAFIGADGKAIPPVQKASDDDKARMTKRERRAGPLAIPADALVKGVNVLAVELHRSPFHPAALTWWNNPNDYPYGRISHWSPIGLASVQLLADGDGIEPNVVRPAGLQLWRPDIHQRLHLDSYGAPGEAAGSIRLTGARNGVFAAQVALADSRPLKGVAARVSDLTAAGGGGRIPASAVQVRYLLEGNATVGLGDSFDALASQPPAERPVARRTDYRLDRIRADRKLPAPVPGAVQPIWITVAVPRDAAAGEYRGELTVSADGVKQPLVAPISLHVADWTLPDPRAFRTHVGIFQSPTTLAMHYKVAEWSEPHWKLMDQSFALLGLAGNNLVNIPISDQTQFGNDEGMVYFVRKEDGSFEYDFSVFDRYLELVRKHLGRPRFVALHVWHAGAWQAKPADQKNTVTLLDRKTGQKQPHQVPVFGTEASAAFWKPVLDAAAKRLADAGMGESMCVGILSDGTAPPDVFKMFGQIAPGIGWTRGCHSVTRAPEPYGIGPGAKVVYHEYCYGGGIADPAKRMPVWNLAGPGTDWRRGWRDAFPAVAFRQLSERSLYAETRGFGRLGLDYWPMKLERAGRTQTVEIFNRWPHSSVGGHGDPTIIALSHPGPDGPLATARFELLREGIQEAEAMLFVSDALSKHADKLGSELAGRCRRLLVERIEVCRMLEGVERDFPAGWQDRSARLYGAAAEVARIVGQGSR